MRRIRWLVLLAIFAMFVDLGGYGPPPPDVDLLQPEVTLLPTDRVLVLAPHPDDETLCCGGIIQRAVTMGLPVRVVFLTYGDNSQWSFLVYRKRPELAPKAVLAMGEIRRNEAMAAAAILGLAPDQLIFLGYPDFSTLNIWYTHWGDQPPLRSMLTKVTAVPYANAFRPGASYTAGSILADLTTILRDFQPTKVFVSHPADRNTDHRALYLFTRVALWELAAEIRPKLYPYLIHYPHWPQPRGYQPSAPMAPPEILRASIDWQLYRLSADEAERKTEALRAHKTQYESNARYLLSFASPNELFGDYPAVRLRASEPEVPLSLEDPAMPEDVPEELTEEEQNAFVGLEWHAVRLDGDQLVITVDFSRPLGKGVGASVYIFGFRGDRPFAEMPKLHIRLNQFGYMVYDQLAMLSRASVQVVRGSRRVTLRVPLSLLGDPSRVLTSVRTYLGEVPLDWVAWRILEVVPGG